MIFEETDIKFEVLTSNDFEELCFDLLSHQGFHSLIWRQGGADSGRDIEAHYTATNALVGTYHEKWFIECKHYLSGVSVDKIMDKFAWARAEKPDHLVIMVSSYLTNSARSWVEKIAPDEPFTTHIIEGKNLKQLILGFSNLVTKYFIDPYRKLLTDIKRNWIVFDLLPDPETLFVLHQNVDLTKLSTSELALLWCVYAYQQTTIEQWARDDNDYFGFEHAFRILQERAQLRKSVLEDHSIVEVVACIPGTIIRLHGFSALFTLAYLFIQNGEELRPAFYYFKLLSPNEGIEILVEGSAELSAKIRLVPQNADELHKKVRETLLKA